jgi:nitroreductase
VTAEEAIASRRSIRAYLPTPVPRDVVERILDIAARAPSGTNMQPWRCYALAGAPLRALCDALVAEAGAKVEAEYRYYPAEFFEPYLARRRKVGWDLYGLLGIARGETEKMRHQHARNFTFFGAPVGIIFTIDRRLEIGSWLDYGMFLGNVTTAARGMGLDTCPQAAFAPHHATIRAMLGIPDNEVVVCGMALGHADPTAPENSLVTDRAPARDFCAFRGWDGD